MADSILQYIILMILVPSSFVVFSVITKALHIRFPDKYYLAAIKVFGVRPSEQLAELLSGGGENLDLDAFGKMNFNCIKAIYTKEKEDSESNEIPEKEVNVDTVLLWLCRNQLLSPKDLAELQTLTRENIRNSQHNKI